MLYVLVAIISSVLSNLSMSYISEQYTYNVSNILLMIECVKLVICFCVMRYLNDTPSLTIRWGFLVNSILYSVVNVLSHVITSLIRPSMYAVLIQHKLIWVVLFSTVLLKKSFKWTQYLSLLLVCVGCIFVKMSSHGGDVTPLAVFYIIIQGVCSSLSSVWIEKMMKIGQRPIISDNESEQKLYWFLSDSFQMYMFGVPLYVIGSYYSDTKTTVPFHLCLFLVMQGVIQGLSLGAIFVYQSSVVRSLVSAIVIVILAIEHGVFTVHIVGGIIMVLFGVMGWVYGKNDVEKISTVSLHDEEPLLPK